jgi:hypothetical protein
MLLRLTPVEGSLANWDHGAASIFQGYARVPPKKSRNASRTHATGVNRRSIWILIAFCAQLHLTPTHFSLLQPKFGFPLTLG